MTATEQEKKAVLAVCSAVIDAVEAGGDQGAPGGILYAALMAHGCTLHQFEMIMGTLVRTGVLVKRGQCYFSAIKKEMTNV